MPSTTSPFQDQDLLTAIQQEIDKLKIFILQAGGVTLENTANQKGPEKAIEAAQETIDIFAAIKKELLEQNTSFFADSLKSENNTTEPNTQAVNRISDEPDANRISESGPESESESESESENLILLKNSKEEFEEAKKKFEENEYVISSKTEIAKQEEEFKAIAQQIDKMLANKRPEYEKLLVTESNSSEEEITITQLQNNFRDKKHPFARRTPTADALLYLYLQKISNEKKLAENELFKELIKGKKTLVVTFETDKITEKHKEFIKAQIQECIKLGIACPPNFKHKDKKGVLRNLNLTEIGFKNTIDMHLMSLVKDIPGLGSSKIDAIKNMLPQTSTPLVTVSNESTPQPNPEDARKKLVQKFLQEAFERSPHKKDTDKLQDIASMLQLKNYSISKYKYKAQICKVITKLQNDETITPGEEKNIADNITSKLLKSMDERLKKIEKNITPKVRVSKDNVSLGPS